MIWWCIFVYSYVYICLCPSVRMSRCLSRSRTASFFLPVFHAFHLLAIYKYWYKNTIRIPLPSLPSSVLLLPFDRQILRCPYSPMTCSVQDTWKVTINTHPFVASFANMHCICLHCCILIHVLVYPETQNTPGRYVDNTSSTHKFSRLYHETLEHHMARGKKFTKTSIQIQSPGNCWDLLRLRLSNSVRYSSY